MKHLTALCTRGLVIVTQHWGHHSSVTALLCEHFQAEMSSCHPSPKPVSFHTQGISVFLHLTTCQVRGHNVSEISGDQMKLENRMGLLNEGFDSWSGGCGRTEPG